MPLYSYRCPNGHAFDRYAALSKDEPLESTPCNEGDCKTQFVIAELVQAMTGKPILKAGRGGFYSPTRT